MRCPVVALVMLASACSDDGGTVDPHALGACDQTWRSNGFTECEAACKESSPALTASGMACEAHTTMGPISCSKTFVFEAATGCCESSAITSTVRFGECD